VNVSSWCCDTQETDIRRWRRQAKRYSVVLERRIDIETLRVARYEETTYQGIAGFKKIEPGIST
jgi:hypothetical protein